MEIKLTVYGTPQALKRHRTVRLSNNFTRTYDPSAGDKTNFLYKAILDRKPSKPIEEAISLEVIFYMPRPKNHYGSGKNSTILKPSAPKYHTGRPDIDNFTKFLFDSFNKIYWHDDSQICKLNAVKQYTDLSPRIEISINTI